MAWDDETTRRPESSRSTARDTIVLRLVHGENGARPPRILREGTLRVGRGASDGEAIADPRLSRVHFEITLDATSHVVLRDRSSHGTFVNGVATHERALEDGDVIRAGDSLFVLRWWPAAQDDAPVPALLGDAPAIRKLRSDIALFAAQTTNVLVTGETGSGKELVARALHAGSARSGPFVAVNASAIPEELAESQLFGHVAGAFSGARGDHVGFFRSAHGGTLFLDEIGDLPRAIQPKLLRAIEEHAVTPIGSARPVRTDVRLVSATNVSLDDAIRSGTFRADLYARLAEVRLRAPSLRERREDVLALFRAALGRSGSPTADLAEALLLHDWPYNVRELGSLAREMAVRAKGGALELSHAGDRLPPVDREEANEPDAAAPVALDRFAALAHEHRGNVTTLARVLGRSRRQIHRYAERCGVDLEALRRS